MSPVEIILVVSLVGAAALIQSLTGFGFALLIVPPLVLLLGPREAVVLSNVVATALGALMFIQLWRAVHWRAALFLIGASIVGMPFGLLVAVRLDADILQIVIAVLVVVFTALLMRGVTLGRRVTDTGSIAAGLVAGVLRTSTSMAGPPVVIYLQGSQMESGAFRSTMTAFFFLSGLVAVAIFAVEGSLDASLGLAGLVSTPAVFGGLYAGSLLYQRIGETRFRGIVFAVLIASAIVAIVAAIDW